MTQLFLAIAIADAYGIGFEFVDQNIVDRDNDLSCFRKGKYDDIIVGQYTDDTQMSLALYWHIVNSMYADLVTPTEIAQAFVSTYQNDPRKGYSRRMQALLESVKDGAGLIRLIDEFERSDGYRSDSNGACMRAIPCGVFREVQSVIDFTYVQSGTTHGDTGVDAAQVVAIAAHHLHWGGDVTGVYDYIVQNFTSLPLGYGGGRVAGKGRLGWKTACAALQALVTTRSYSECLHKAVSYGGDTDSVAAIACGLAALDKSRIMDIPTHLIEGFKNADPIGYMLVMEADSVYNQYDRGL